MERKLHAHPLHKLRAAAQAVGEVSLESKFAAASESLCRGFCMCGAPMSTKVHPGNNYTEVAT
ncbi:Superkiller viralicidic [Salix suchowensis]|nr:Superkiller viralicidic [Salix suchowensis]